VFHGVDGVLLPGSSLGARSLLPNLAGLFVERGSAFGRDSLVTSSSPSHVSLPGYLELMRGADLGDCSTNFCSPSPSVVLPDYFDSPAVFASWGTVARALGDRVDRMLVSAGRDFRTARLLDLHLPDDRDFVRHVGHMDYRPDRHTARAALGYLDRGLPSFLWIALGDGDEHAHLGDYVGYLRALVSADSLVGELVRRYEGVPTLFIVTTDHGRSRDWRHHGRDSSSARVWLFALGAGVPALGHVRLPRPASLSAVLPTVLHLTHGVSSPDRLF
jgi:Metalloenzyme superfamily